MTVLKKTALFLFIFSSIISFCRAQDNVFDQIIWVVGDEAILKSDVEKVRIGMISRGERIEGDPYCFIPEQLAVQKLFLDQAKVDSIDVPASEVNRGVTRQENMAIANLGSKEKVEEYLQAPMNQLREEWREEMRNSYLVSEVKKNLVGKKANLTPSEVRRYYSQLSQDSLPYIPTTVEVQILTNEPVIPISEIDKVKARLRDFTDRINKGESFSTFAIMYSEDGSASNGGELPFTGRAGWVPEFANMAFSLNDPKKVSNIVETEYGFHIIQLMERRGDLIKVRHILLKPKVPEAELSTAMNKLDTITSDIKANKYQFEDAVAYLSSDKDTRGNNGLMVNRGDNVNHGTPRFTMEQLPPEVAKVIDKMKVGEVSIPFKMKQQSNQKDVVAIVKLRSRVEGHVANVSDDYQTLKEIVEERKQEEILRKWLQSKIKDTYVRIDDNWKNCDFQYSGWLK